MDGWMDEKVNFMLRINEMNLMNLYIYLIFPEMLYYIMEKFLCLLSVVTEINITIKKRCDKKVGIHCDVFMCHKQRSSYEVEDVILCSEGRLLRNLALSPRFPAVVL